MAQSWILLAGAALLAFQGPAEQDGRGFHLVAGSIPLGRGPDGNSVFLEAPQGLILVDTGRHPAHAEKLLAYARQKGRPLAAIVNSHWHLDHTTGNLDIRHRYPAAHVYGTTALEGALTGFLARGRDQSDKRLADPDVPAEQKAQLRRGRHRIDHPDTLRPTIAVGQSRVLSIAGRELDIRVAPFAVTEADLWIHVPEDQLVIAGDLVVDIVPFMDTACPDGWSKALEEIAATPFATLVPGHGAPMSRTQFLQWKDAFDGLVSCGRSSRPVGECVAGWKRAASPFIGPAHQSYVTESATYYVETRLRSSAQEQQRYCRQQG